MSNEIQEVTDLTGDTVLVCRGVVTGVFPNEIPEDKVKTYKGSKPGSTFTPKFRPVIVIGDTRLGLGQRENDRIQGKVKGGGDKDYVPVTVGAEVMCIVDKSEYNGKTYYNTKPSKITVLKQGEAPQQGGGQSNQKSSGGGYNLAGIQTGHGVNAAFRLLSYKHKDMGEVLEYAKQLHDITLATQERYQEQHPEMSKSDVGQSVGNAVLNACAILTKTKVGEVGDVAWDILQEVSVPLYAHIKDDVPAQEGEASAPEQDDDEFDNDLPF